MAWFFKHFALGITLLFTAVSAALIVVWQSSGIGLYSVKDDSMAPDLRKGDMVAVVKAQPQSIQSGDTVSYLSFDQPAAVSTAKVLAVEPAKGLIITKTNPHKPVAFKAIIGRSVKSFPKLGYLLDGLHDPKILVSFIYFPALAVIAAELRLLISRYSRRAYKISR